MFVRVVVAEEIKQSFTQINKDYIRQSNQLLVDQVEKEPKKAMLMSFDCAEYIDTSKNDHNYQKFKDNYLQKMLLHIQSIIPIY